MNFDMSIFNGLALPLVVAACLVLGYIIKKSVFEDIMMWFAQFQDGQK